LLYVAIRAARKAGDIIARAYDDRVELNIKHKADHDFVTSIDRKAEAAIIREIRHHYPQDGIIAEESEAINSDAVTRWYIDPLDGTTNFVHGYPHFAVSIGVWRGSKPLLGVVFDPLRNEIFEAENGKGAFLNRRRLRVARREKISEAMYASGLPAYRRDLIESFQARMKACFPVADSYRRGGSAALDLAYVACGRLDAYWEEGLMPWDIAAGAILVQEAGGMVTDFSGASLRLEKGEILVANEVLHPGFLKLIA